MIEYEDKEDSFEFEKSFCFEKPEIWRIEANGLFASARVLLEFSALQDKDIFENEKILRNYFSPEIADRYFWYYRIIRMLWGYGFENILKGIIIKDLNKNSLMSKEVPFDKIKTHNLLLLFKEAGFSLNNHQEFYLKIIQKCSIWMGRYPLPTSANQMYEQRKPMNSREELYERSKLMHHKLLKGEIDRIECESDVLHSAIRLKELEIVTTLIGLTNERIIG